MSHILTYYTSKTDENDPQRASVLSIETDLPKLYDACFTTYIFRSFNKRVAVWARFLLQFAIIGRSSDVTTHCPTINKVQFPTSEIDYLPDGLPRFIVIFLDDWKSRPTWHKSQTPNGYRLRLYANHLDTRFCPVHWLLLHWHLEGIARDDQTGPIIAHCVQDQYRKDLKKLFNKCGFAYTSHSVRRSAAQWGRRCGADLVILRNVGRWTSRASPTN